MANEFVARNGVIAQNNSIVSGSLIVTQGITGSLFGTASFASSASLAIISVTSSYPINVTGSTIYSTNPITSNFNNNNSIFLGLSAGSQSLNAEFSNFLGSNAGNLASNAAKSNFLGLSAGQVATNASESNFIGVQAGSQATNAYQSNMIGYLVGNNATNANNSNFLGNQAGSNATNATFANFLGYQAGYGATFSNNSNFLGQNAGSGSSNAYNSNFIGQFSGIQATNAYNSNFLGYAAGRQATNANNSNFLGNGAGYLAINANSSNFIGSQAGISATNANQSNFIGYYAGWEAGAANTSNFLGSLAGYGATNASQSNFIGLNAGLNATNAALSIFIGNQAGYEAKSASYSTLIGYNVGKVVGGGGSTGIGTNNIVIGTNISLPDNTQNAINLGGIIFASGTYSDINTNPSISPTNGKVGINIVNPTTTLDVSGSGRFTSDLTVTNALKTFPSTGNTFIGLTPSDGGFKLDVNGTTRLQNTLTISTGGASITGSLNVTGSGRFTNGVNITGSLLVYSGSTIISSSNTPPAPTQFIPFTDDYNRATLSPGGTPSLTYTNTNTGTGNATIVTNYLNIVNGGVAGQSYTTVPLSGFGTPFNPTLANNNPTSSIEWTFNLRTNRGAIFSGFGATQYGGAVILAGSNTNLQSLGSGYALVYGGTGTRNWRLVRYNNGLSGTLTDIISGGTFASNTSYVSVRIIYAPATNTWTYYFRDDGTTAWGDPTTTSTLIGTAVDSTYTSTLMSVFGIFYNYSTAANQNLQFDNLRVQQSVSSPFVGIDIFTIKNYLGTSIFNIKDDGVATITGSLTVTSGITGSLFGTSSWANNVVTASYVLNAVSSSFATTASFTTSASFASTSNLATSASFAPNIYNTNGTLTAARTITLGANPLSIAGSTTTRFFSNGRVGIATTTDGGFQLDVNGTTRLQGALTISTGGATVTGALNASNITGSLFGTSSWAVSASWAPGGSPGGSNTQIQYNNGSTFAGITSFTFNYASQSLQQGNNVTASGLYSHAQGYLTTASGNYSHTEGYITQATGEASHAEGYSTHALANISHAEGLQTQAIGEVSHAEGQNTKTGTQKAYYAQSIVSGVITLSGSYGNVSSNFVTNNVLYLYDKPFDANYVRTVFTISQSYFSSPNTIIELYDTSVNTTTAYVGDLYFNISNWIGNQTIPGDQSHAEGFNTVAVGLYSHAEGSSNQAIGNASHAEGYNTQAIGNYSHTEGDITIANGYASHAEGYDTKAIGAASHAEGEQTQAKGDYSHAEGSNTISSGSYSHAEGVSTQARGFYSHAEGWATLAIGAASHTEGYVTQAIGTGSHAEGYITQARGNYSHAEGIYTTASGSYSHAEGNSTQALGLYSHAEGSVGILGAPTLAIGDHSHVEGSATKTGTQNAYYAESAINGVIVLTGSYGNITSSFSTDNTLYYDDTNLGAGNTGIGFFPISRSYYSAPNTIIELYNTSVNSDAAAAVGNLTIGITNWTGDLILGAVGAHSEGYGTLTIGSYSHAEGAATQAIGAASHTEGYQTIAFGGESHAEGYQTTASGSWSHAEGYLTTAIGLSSHAEGYETQVLGDGSHAEGYQTIASGSFQHVSGKHNEHNNTDSLFIVGIGLSDVSRKDGFTVDVDANGSGSIMIPNNVDAPSVAKTGSMYVDPANNKLWIYTGNGGISGWVTASLG